MKSGTGSNYEAPRAVRMADMATGEFQCSVGTAGNINLCNPNGSIPDVPICATGTMVSF